jgi:hypothetical protein
MSLGNITNLLEQRLATFTTQTNEIISKFSEKLTLAFQKIYNAPGRKIVWTAIDSIKGTDKAVVVSGFMALEIGETIHIGDKEILLDETNVNEYNKLVKFGFPIIMLELATTEELVEHINRISKIGGAMEVSPEALAKILDKVSEEYHTKILSDPTKVEVVDAATRPESVLGFDAAGLTDEQIRKLKFYEKFEVETVN